MLKELGVDSTRRIGCSSERSRIYGHSLVPGPGIIGNTPWIVFNETRTMQERLDGYARKV